MQENGIPSQDKMKKFEGIDAALNVDLTLVPSSSEIEPINAGNEIEVPAIFDKEQLKKDYEFTRGNLYSLIQKGQEAVDGILELARESDQPRAYEVAGQLVKHIGDVAEKLMDLQKKVSEIENPTKKKRDTQITNNTMFVGSTAELAKFLKQQREINKSEQE